MKHGAAQTETLAIASPAAPPDFRAVYQAHFPFVWRTVRRLGVAALVERRAALVRRACDLAVALLCVGRHRPVLHDLERPAVEADPDRLFVAVNVAA